MLLARARMGIRVGFGEVLARATEDLDAGRLGLGERAFGGRGCEYVRERLCSDDELDAV